MRNYLYESKLSSLESRHQAKAWQPQKQADLRDFLITVADTACKVHVLRLFLRKKGVFLSSLSLAKRLERCPFEVRRAVRELHSCGVLNYSPHFGDSDLCSLRCETLEPVRLLQVELLETALYWKPNAVWSHFGTHPYLVTSEWNCNSIIDYAVFRKYF